MLVSFGSIELPLVTICLGSSFLVLLNTTPGAEIGAVSDDFRISDAVRSGSFLRSPFSGEFNLVGEK